MADTNVLENDIQRVSIYDWLRLIAIILVVIGHSAYLNIQTPYGGIDYVLADNTSGFYNSNILKLYRFFTGWVYGFHMPLFFMLSGAVMALKPLKSFDNIFKAKIKRLIIPYFVYGYLFMFPIKRLGNFYDNNSIQEALKSFSLGGESGHLWFLSALFWCTIIFIIYEKFLLKQKIKSIYLALLMGGVRTYQRLSSF